MEPIPPVPCSSKGAEIILAIIISSAERIPNFYQNIKKKWSLELDKILNVGLYCILVGARRFAEKQREKQ